jgi:hypothetical protein
LDLKLTRRCLAGFALLLDVGFGSSAFMVPREVPLTSPSCNGSS